MERRVGLFGAIVTLVGFVIGASIFLLPGELAASAGPGVIISYAIASVVAAFSCVIAALVGAMFPISGASFVCATKMTSPILGFLMIWLLFAGVSMGVALVAHGFAGYLDTLISGLDKPVIAVGIVVTFGLINLLGASASVAAQTLMVLVFMAVLLVFSSIGVAEVNGDLLVPFFPNGYVAVLMAAVPAFFSYAGFLMIIELGGEIKNPSRTIPLTLLISFLVVWLSYTAVSLAIVGQIPLLELANNDAPVATVAGILFPDWGGQVITYTVLMAAATSINALLLGYSRDIYVLAQVRIFPEMLSRSLVKNGGTHGGVILLTITSVVAVLVGAEISEYASFIVMSLMFSQVLLGVAALLFSRKMPDRLSTIEFRLSSFWRAFFSLGLIIFSSLFIIIGTLGSPEAAMLLALLLMLGVAYYLLRKLFLKSRDINMEDWIMAHIDESIKAFD